jgi:hypothetical protein
MNLLFWLLYDTGLNNEANHFESETVGILERGMCKEELYQPVQSVPSFFIMWSQYFYLGQAWLDRTSEPSGHLSMQF